MEVASSPARRSRLSMVSILTRSAGVSAAALAWVAPVGVTASGSETSGIDAVREGSAASGCAGELGSADAGSLTVSDVGSAGSASFTVSGSGTSVSSSRSMRATQSMSLLRTASDCDGGDPIPSRCSIMTSRQSLASSKVSPSPGGGRRSRLAKNSRISSMRWVRFAMPVTPVMLADPLMVCATR